MPDPRPRPPINGGPDLERQCAVIRARQRYFLHATTGKDCVEIGQTADGRNACWNTTVYSLGPTPAARRLIYADQGLRDDGRLELVLRYIVDPATMPNGARRCSTSIFLARAVDQRIYFDVEPETTTSCLAEFPNLRVWYEDRWTCEQDAR